MANKNVLDIYSTSPTNELQNTLQGETGVILEPDISPNIKLTLGSTISKNGIVTLVRGDTLVLKASLNIGTPLQPLIFELEEGDYLVLRLFTANSSWESYLLDKEATMEDVDDDNNVLFTITNEDSEYLRQGQYYYQIRLFYTRDGDERVITLMPRTKFYVVD